MTESLADHDFAQARASVEKGSSPTAKVEIAVRRQQKPPSQSGQRADVTLGQPRDGVVDLSIWELGL